MSRSSRGNGPVTPPALADRSIEQLPPSRKIVYRPRERRLAEAVTAPEAPMRVSRPGACTDPSSPMRSAEPSVGYHIADQPAAVPAFPDVYEVPTVDSVPIHSDSVEAPWTSPWRLAVTSVAFVAAMLVAWGVLVAL